MLLGIVLVGAIWAMRPIINSQVVRAAQTQTAAANSPAAFTGSLTQLPSIERMRMRHSVYVAA
jgi:hypothetical protein